MVQQKQPGQQSRLRVAKLVGGQAILEYLAVAAALLIGMGVVWANFGNEVRPLMEKAVNQVPVR